MRSTHLLYSSSERFSGGYGTHAHSVGLAGGGFCGGSRGGYACQLSPSSRWGEVHARSYLLAVDGEDNVAGTHIGFLEESGPPATASVTSDAITLVVRVEERTQICCRHGRSGTAVATAGMGSVEFAQNLAQQNREVIVVGDMGRNSR